MDFKVAGTAEFVTALQLDTKIDGIPADVLAAALDQAREARLAILEVMNGAIAEPRPEVRATAPKIVSFTIPIDKIGEVIGPKGKVINTIQQETGADINVDDDGVGRHGHHRLARRPEGRRGPPPDRADHQPAHGQGRRGLHRQGRQHHQVRRLRQHPPGPRRPGPHLQAGPGQAHQPGGGRRRPRRRDRGAGRRHRPERQGQPHARSATSSDGDAAGGQAERSAERSGRRRPPAGERRRPAPRRSRSRTPSTPRPVRSSATSARPGDRRR